MNGKPHDSLPVRIGVSRCLLGERVRYDGEIKRDGYVTDILGRHLDLVPVCPEVELGMGVPREAVDLFGDPDSPRMVGAESGKDWTAPMYRFARRRVRQPDLRDVDGFILKSRSPSCGMRRVKLHPNPGRTARKGTGLFARALLDRYPHMPVAEDEQLGDPDSRESFVVRIFAFQRLRDMFNGPFRRKSVVEFHTAHKYLLLAHGQKYYRKLGQMVAGLKGYTPRAFREQYQALFMEALSYRSTVRKNVNVLQHIMGFLKRSLVPNEKRALVRVIDEYHRGMVPLPVPVALLRHHAEKYGVQIKPGEAYLYPHPTELMLRYHA